ncbi:MAG: 30S ribosomal protein S16 [Phycisphaerae bacterium]
MAVKLRLKRIGRTHRSVYRLAAIDSRDPRDGRVLEELGLYDPEHQDAAGQVRALNADRIQHWLSCGAQPTDTVRQLLQKNGIAVKS